MAENQNNRWKKIFANFKIWLNQRWGLVLMSLIFAILVWNLVISEADPLRQMTIGDVPVSVQGLDKLENQGLTVKGNVYSYVDQATLRVEMKRSEMLRSSNADVSAYLDLSGINAPGTYDAPIKATTSRGTISSVSPSTVKVVVEELSSKIVAVNYVLTGQLPDNYWHSDPELSSKQLRISGAQSDISQIDHAQVTVDMTGMSGEASATCDFEFLNTEGVLVDAAGISLEVPNCVVRMDVYPIKTMQVSADAFFLGSPQEGYEISSVNIYPSQVRLVGTEDNLSAVTQLQLTPMDVSGSNTDQTFNTTLQLPDGVTSLDGTDLVVIVRVTPKVVDTQFDNVAVEVRNLGSGLRVAGDGVTVQAVLTAQQLYSRRVTAEKLGLYVDASGLGAGTHELTIRSDLPATADEVEKVTTTPQTISITLEKR